MPRGESVEGVSKINSNQDVEDQALGIGIDSMDAYADEGEHQGTDMHPQSYDMLSELSFALSEQYQEAGTLGGSAGCITERDTRLQCGEFPSRAFSAHSRLTKGIRVCETCMAVYSRIHLSLLEPGPSADGSAVLIADKAAAARAAHPVCKPQQPDAGPADHDNPIFVDRYHHSRPESAASVRQWSPHVLQARGERFQPDVGLEPGADLCDKYPIISRAPVGTTSQIRTASASVLVGHAAAGAASRSKFLAAKHMLQPMGEAAPGRGASKSTTTSWRPAGVIAPASGTTEIRL